AASGAPPAGGPGNLPRPRTSFIGREEEAAEIEAMLTRSGNREGGTPAGSRAPGPRLVTLTGTGGVGKTRLAIEVARRLSPGFAEGVSFIDLSAITDPALVPYAAAAALGVHEDPG